MHSFQFFVAQQLRLTTAVNRTAFSLGNIQIFQWFVAGWCFNAGASRHVADTIIFRNAFPNISLLGDVSRWAFWHRYSVTVWLALGKQVVAH